MVQLVQHNPNVLRDAAVHGRDTGQPLRGLLAGGPRAVPRVSHSPNNLPGDRQKTIITFEQFSNDRLLPCHHFRIRYHASLYNTHRDRDRRRTDHLLRPLRVHGGALPQRGAERREGNLLFLWMFWWNVGSLYHRSETLS